MDYDLMTFPELKALAAERGVTVPTPRPPLKLQPFDVAQALRAAEVTHQCPALGSGTMPCCGRTPFEVPGWHRITLNELVTCGGA